MNIANPIGIFDSGVGGTSIAKEIHQLLPHENIIYLADSKNAPYGTKSREDIIALSIKNTEQLITHGVKVIVVACNTATTNAIDVLREKYTLPFIGIEPAIKPAAIKTINKKIGILATKGTLASELFSKTTEKYVSDNIQVIQVEGKGIVEAIEKNEHNSPDFIINLHHQLEVFKREKIDCLVLGCTHYPYIIRETQRILPGVKIIDSGYAVAKQVRRVLYDTGLLCRENKGLVSVYMYSNSTSLDSIKDITKNKFSNLTITYKDF